MKAIWSCSQARSLNKGPGGPDLPRADLLKLTTCLTWLLYHPAGFPGFLVRDERRVQVGEVINGTLGGTSDAPPCQPQLKASEIGQRDYAEQKAAADLAVEPVVEGANLFGGIAVPETPFHW